VVGCVALAAGGGGVVLVVDGTVCSHKLGVLGDGGGGVIMIL